MIVGFVSLNYFACRARAFVTFNFVNVLFVLSRIFVCVCMIEVSLIRICFIFVFLFVESVVRVLFNGIAICGFLNIVFSVSETSSTIFGSLFVFLSFIGMYCLLSLVMICVCFVKFFFVIFLFVVFSIVCNFFRIRRCSTRIVFSVSFAVFSIFFFGMFMYCLIVFMIFNGVCINVFLILCIVLFFFLCNVVFNFFCVSYVVSTFFSEFVVSVVFCFVFFIINCMFCVLLNVLLLRFFFCLKYVCVCVNCVCVLFVVVASVVSFVARRLRVVVVNVCVCVYIL